MKSTVHIPPPMPSAPRGFKHPKTRTKPWAWSLVVGLTLWAMAPSLSAQTCPSGSAIATQYATDSSGGYGVGVTFGAGAPDDSGIAVHNTGTTFQGIFTYAQTFTGGMPINITAKYIDTRVDGIRVAFSSDGTTWTTNSPTIGGFGAIAAANYTTVSYTIPTTLTGAYKYIRVQGNSGQTYVSIDAIQTTKTECFLFNAATFIDDGAGGGIQNNCIKDGTESITASPAGLNMNVLQGSTLVRSYSVTNGQATISGLADGTYTLIITNSPTATTSVLPIGYASSNPSQTIVIAGGVLSSPASPILYCLQPLDNDNDGVPDSADLDDDNDGILEPPR